MRFQFDPNQSFQQRAVASVVDLFQGLTRQTDSINVRVGMFEGEIDAVRFDVDEVRLLADLQAVQATNRLPADAELKKIEEIIDLGKKKQIVSFPNFSVEMETG